MGEEDDCWISNLHFCLSSPITTQQILYLPIYFSFLLKMALAGLEYMGTHRAVLQWLGRAWANFSVGTVAKQQGSQMKYHWAGNCLDSAGDCTNFMSQMFSVPCLPKCQIHRTQKQITFQTPIFQLESGNRTIKEVRRGGGEKSLWSLYRPDI